MNAKRLNALSRAAVLAALACMGMSAHARGDVFWAVDVNAPVQGLGYVGTTVSNTPHGVAVYNQPPVMVVQQPVMVVQPQPVYAPTQVVYANAPMYAPVVYNPEPAWRHRFFRHGHHHDHHDHGGH